MRVYSEFIVLYEDQPLPAAEWFCPSLWSAADFDADGDYYAEGVDGRWVDLRVTRAEPGRPRSTAWVQSHRERGPYESGLAETADLQRYIDYRAEGRYDHDAPALRDIETMAVTMLGFDTTCMDDHREFLETVHRFLLRTRGTLVNYGEHLDAAGFFARFLGPDVEPEARLDASTEDPGPDAGVPAPGPPSPHSAIGLRLEAARRLGYQVTSLDPETRFLHELRRDGRTRVLMGGLSPLNDAAASRLAGDKFHTATALSSVGLRVPDGVRCLRPGRFSGFESHTGRGPAQRLADRVGFPLVVKPNSGSRGRGVGLVHDRTELARAIDSVWADDYLALVQVPVRGMDLRIDLLDDDCIFAYVRRPLVLVGDGRRSLGQLLADADPRFTEAWCRAHLAEEPGWRARVESRGMSLQTVPDAGEVFDFGGVVLNLNRLCVGEVVPALPPDWLAMAQRIARRMSLRHLGIDLKIESLEQDPAQAVVIEVNASPSLSNMAMAGHYARVLAVEQRIVSALFDGLGHAPEPR